MQSGKKTIPPFLAEKRRELIWALLKQGYSVTDVGYVFGITKQRCSIIASEMPKGWTTPWSKRRD